MQDQENPEEDSYDFQPPINPNNTLKSFTERYFTQYHNPQYNQYAFLHSNKLFLVGITKSHPLIGQIPTKISFEGLNKGMPLSVVGKKKKGGIKIEQNTYIAQVWVGDTIYKLRGVVDGFIIELNDQLLKNPSWLVDYPESKGYICVVNPGTIAYKKQLLYLEEYITQK